MTFAPRKPTLMMLLTVGLIILLPVLAVLQYRWMGQVSEGERERLQKNLREGATRFTQDFDQEIARLFFSFNPTPSHSDKAPETDLSACYARWSQDTAFPGLLKDIYSINANTGGELDLRRFDPATRKLESAEWADELSDLKGRLQEQLRTWQTKAPPPSSMPIIATAQADFMRVIRNEIEPILGDIPALVIHRIPANFGTEKTIVSLQSSTYLVLVLDLDTIKREVIPQLAAAYFSGNNGLDYNLTVINRRAPTEIIYQSDHQALGPDQPNDATVNLFNIRFNEINTLFQQRGRAIVKEETETKKAVAIQVFRSDSLRTAGSLPTASLFSTDSGAWQLLLKHRAGSLDSVVAGARYRNLAISFGILLLLAVSVCLIVLSTRRAYALANQQMEFVAGVSHELRTPLAVIRAAGENLADGVIDEREQIKRYGELIAGEGRRLTEMVEQVLEFSGIQSGRQNYTLRPTEATAVIEHAITACQPMATEQGFEIRQEIDANLGQIAADEAALSRSLQNLLTNAMKYSGDRRTIAIRATLARAHDTEPEVQITVADQGTGIDATDLPHIFEPFYRGREATAAQIHGSGLGLSLVKQIVEAHGGRVSIVSSKGKGSAFTIHLKSLASLASGSSESSESPDQSRVFNVR